jgi:hypothetical protein
MRSICIILITLIVLIGSGRGAIAESSYLYPFTNPYEATVIETPTAFQAALPKKIPQTIVNLKVFPQRHIPKVFWYENGLSCSLAQQNHKAPLIFIIAGTGARYDSPKMVDLQRALYQAGFHVFSISSPTHMDFVINASTSMVPGDLTEDAKDLYRVMRLAMEKVSNQISVTNYFLTGYSLGGIQSAFVSKLDEEQKQFQFKKVLLINPPVSLYRSVSILDRLLDDNIPGGINNFKAWLDDVMQNLSDIYKEMGYFEFSGEYIYKVHERYPRREPVLRAIIGLSFRMSSSNMIFTADIMNGGGYITPKNAGFNYATSLTPYAMVASRTTFGDYFHQYLFPHVSRFTPNLTEENLIARLSLNYLEPYLRQANKIGVLHNQDDIILGPGDIDYIRQIFGPRAKIYPLGGHCGNMNHPDVVRFMTNFFRTGEN